MPSVLSTASVAAVLAGSAYAGFNSGSNTNVAVYWGQNSYGSGSGSTAQQNLATYCANSDIDVIPMAFLVEINGAGGQPVLNFANSQNNCSTFSGTDLIHCPQIGQDIQTCQSQYGKQILLSFGGATYSEGGFASSSDAVTAANNLWAMFGPEQSGSSALRPFDSAVIDGMDLDFEATVNNGAAFANQMLANFATDSSKKYLLTAAPQCPYPDAYDSSMTQGEVAFDILWVQFYNNYCGVQSYTAGSTTQNNFNFATWDNWAKTVSKNPNVKVMLGIPAGPTGAGSGYEPASTLAGVIDYCKTFSSFGGVMMWDASQAYANSGFLAGVASDLGKSTKKLVKKFSA